MYICVCIYICMYVYEHMQVYMCTHKRNLGGSYSAIQQCVQKIIPDSHTWIHINTCGFRSYLENYIK